MTITTTTLVQTIPYLVLGATGLLLWQIHKLTKTMNELRRDTRKLSFRQQAMTTRLYNAAGVKAPQDDDTWAQEILNMGCVQPIPMCAMVFDPDDDFNNFDDSFIEE